MRLSHQIIIISLSIVNWLAFIAENMFSVRYELKFIYDFNALILNP
jgi:hypothetical protein